MSSIPEGYALVPIEPTEAMLFQAWKTGDIIMPKVRAAYAAMIAAAPKPVTDDGHSFERP